ncbi:hypothetical protein CYLTODRAFT_495565 [Cylindrobasidium torrendii FP15055 ss-10]|uniref:Uncharacterized protein n=1 Tax=Cylindrobasidium torrendii FP15055 ss-10 TaxID=1314674 RepID=A0A0D7AQJ0_9AGAR|nr:hypothetical protein CYLTODRAFT_495565 [Cylindrobasidium torrendii FP15055 ss-10]
MPTATIRVETYAPISEFPEPLIVPLFATDIPKPAYHRPPIHRGFMREALRARRPHPYRQDPPTDLPQHPPRAPTPADNPPLHARTPANDVPPRARTPANNPPSPARTPANNTPPRARTPANDPPPQGRTSADDPPRAPTPVNDLPADDERLRSKRPRRVRLADEASLHQTAAVQPATTQSRPILIPKPSKTPLKGLDATSLDLYRKFARRMIKEHLKINQPFASQDEFAMQHAEKRFKAEFADLRKYEDFWPVREVLRDQLKSLKDTQAKAEKRK